MTACVKCGFDPSRIVTASWTFLVERDPPSLNDRVFNAGPRRWLYRRERDAWVDEIRVARMLQRIPRAIGKRRVTIMRVYGGRQKERDRDNLIGGQKIVLDALVFEDLLISDSASGVDVTYHQERGQPTGLRITIEELG